jgi:hypothetical protein
MTDVSAHPLNRTLEAQLTRRTCISLVYDRSNYPKAGVHGSATDIELVLIQHVFVLLFLILRRGEVS